MENEGKKQRIGVYICHCGGNISDYVDVEQLSDIMKREEGVVISRDVMFTCADSNQKEMIRDIHEHHLDGFVVASCSPKLHLHTFRNVAQRAGLNPYNYVQVNVREQCSWAHSDHPDQASVKAAGLIRAGIRRVSYSEALEPLRITAVKSVVIIGAGVAGMRAAIELARMGNEVFLVEKEAEGGGQVAAWDTLYPTGTSGKDLTQLMLKQIREIPAIKLFTNATVEHVSGSLGNFMVEVKIRHEKEESLKLPAGAILVTTGFDSNLPAEGTFGYGLSDRVLTLPEFRKRIDEASGNLMVNGKKIRIVAFIYCVGMRQEKGGNKYCSRTCCTTTMHASLELHRKFGNVKAIHLYRDIRTYGKQEVLYNQASQQGDLFMMFKENDPPVVSLQDSRLKIEVTDHLTDRTRFELEPDLLVLVTGMVPRSDSDRIAQLLKIPVGNDKFFNEIHPKLRPVETVINGIMLGGSCQGPKNITESIQSSLSAAAKINAILCKESLELEPIVARINEEACTWCGICAGVCDYDAIFQMETDGKVIAGVNGAACTGCGICAPVCPADAIEVAQYTNHEIESMIDGFMAPVILEEKLAEPGSEEETGEGLMKEYPGIWKEILKQLDKEPLTIPQIAKQLQQESELITYHVMTMNKYRILEPAGTDEDLTFYLYTPKTRLS
ncbi:MAG: CoB--CoM heterodisulfide reductase iron-sulfur subunit A family protein [Bacteroidetes bacterium]|nr:MAG: CoB--CoM heterodisulfide reductase iron-sulfur subunit A family protein [Bacteroidota bacterium]